MIQDNYKVVSKFLTLARQELSLHGEVINRENGFSVQPHPLMLQYDNFIKTMNYELAWDILYEAHHQPGACLVKPNNFWLYLSASASLMDLPTKVQKAVAQIK